MVGNWLHILGDADVKLGEAIAAMPYPVLQTPCWTDVISAGPAFATCSAADKMFGFDSHSLTQLKARHAPTEARHLTGQLVALAPRHVARGAPIASVVMQIAAAHPGGKASLKVWSWSMSAIEGSKSML